MQHIPKHRPVPPLTPREAQDLPFSRQQTLLGGESREGHLTGTRALMLAVLEDAIRSYLGSTPLLAADAECWFMSSQRHSPFSFLVICEVLDLDASAVRKTILQMKKDRVSPRKALPRVRNNARSVKQVRPKSRS